jgi:hypothetical protein
MAFGTVRLERDGLSSCVDAVLEERSPFRCGCVAAEPVIGARQLPRRFERGWPAGAEELRAPQVGGFSSARKVRPIGIQRVGRLGTEAADIE